MGTYHRLYCLLHQSSACRSKHTTVKKNAYLSLPPKQLLNQRKRKWVKFHLSPLLIKFLITPLFSVLRCGPKIRFGTGAGEGELMGGGGGTDARSKLFMKGVGLSSTLHLVHYALLLTPACWKSNHTNTRLMASAPSLALNPTFGIHSHKTCRH